MPSVDLDQYGRPPLPQLLRAQLRDAFYLLPQRAYACQVLFADLQTNRTTMMLAAREEWPDGRTGDFKVVGPAVGWSGPAPTMWFGLGKIWLRPKPKVAEGS